MASYYFLLSSLPMLRAEGKPPLTYAEFLERCKSCVGAGRYALLESLTPASDRGPLLADWSKFYAALEGELTDLRNGRLGRQPQRRGGGDGALRREISAAIEGKDPLEAEKALLALQFKKLDELIGTHAFDDCAASTPSFLIALIKSPICISTTVFSFSEMLTFPFYPVSVQKSIPLLRIFFLFSLLRACRPAVFFALALPRGAPFRGQKKDVVHFFAQRPLFFETNPLAAHLLPQAIFNISRTYAPHCTWRSRFLRAYCPGWHAWAQSGIRALSS